MGPHRNGMPDQISKKIRWIDTRFFRNQSAQTIDPGPGNVGQRCEPCIKPAMRFAKIVTPGIKPVFRHPIPGLHASGNRPDMGYRAFPHIGGFPSRLCSAAAKIGLFKIQKEGFIKQSDLIQHLSTDHQACARQPIRRPGLFRNWQRNNMPGKEPRKNTGASRALEFRINRREPECRAMRLAIGAVNETACQPSRWIGLQMLYQGMDCTTVRKRIGVQNINEIRRLSVQ